MSTTCIRGADWVIAWDEAEGRHAYLRDGDVVFEGESLSFVGTGYEGPVDVEVPGLRGRDLRARL